MAEVTFTQTDPYSVLIDYIKRRKPVNKQLVVWRTECINALVDRWTDTQVVNEVTKPHPVYTREQAIISSYAAAYKHAMINGIKRTDL